MADPAEEGSAEYPFEISTVEDLALLSQHPDATFVLVNDIDCAGVAFSMLEMPGEGFSGTWNGNGHVIRNLSIQGTNAALMDKIAPEGHIYDLRIETPSVTADDTASVLALQCKGTLERVFVLGGQVAGVNASGLVGTADGSAVLSCAASAQVRGTQSAGALFLSVSGTCRLESVFALSEGLPAASDASASDIPVLDLSPETVSGSQADTVTVLGDFPAELLARIAFSSSDETVFTVGSDGSLILTGAGTANLTVSLSVGTDVYRYTKSITVEISEDLPADSTAPEEETSDEPDAPVSPLSLTGWQEIDGSRYYYDANGVPVTGWQMIDGRRYYFAEDGKQQTGFWCYAGQYWYYYDESGQLPAPGWNVISGYMRYVSNGGSFLTGKQVINGTTYYFGSSGILQTNTVVEDGGKRYFVDGNGAVQYGWQTAGGFRYYSDEANGIYTGWQMIDGRRYYFAEDGKQQIGFWCYAGAYWYYYDENGQLPAPGWQVISGYMRYVSSGGSFVTGVQLIDGKYYLFGESGIQQKGWAEVYGQLYHSDANGYVTFGWYDENGNRYYFDPSTGAAYRNGIFTIENIRYQFDANGVCLGRVVDSTEGIDVSAHQGSVDWEAVAESGIKYAIIRAVTWSNSEGYYIIDPYFEQNVRNAKSNGLLVGAYLYSYAFSESEISEEVFFFHNSAEMQRLRKDGIVLDLPVFIDYEDPLILQNTSSNSQRTNIVRYGMTLLDQLGYSTGFYTYDYFARNYMDAQALINEGYDFWVANFNGTNSFEGQAEIWQYTSTGSVPGVTGNVDRNRFYKTYTSGGGSIPTPTPNQFTVTDQNTNSIVTDSVTNILAKIVQNEVGGGLGLTGADKLKLYTAQAVAANSWLQYQYAHGITAPEVGLKTVTDSSIYTAVEEAQKYVVTYNGEAACTVYGSASGTMTNSSERMGWGALPYLVSVKSKYESSFGSKYQGYTIQNKISTATMKNSIEKMLGAGATNGYPTSQWLQNPVFDSNGYCISIQVCGKTVNGGKFYENCYNLLSPKFEIIENGENGVWVFKTWGNGHCVGMSQYGAAGYIQTGMSWQDVLLHYYPGTTISNK